MLRTTIKSIADRHVQFRRFRIGKNPDVTVGIVTYRRPKFLEECLKSMTHKPGRSFELLIWDNENDNIGSDAIRHLYKKAKGKYFVVIEEDIIWFADNWLDDLIKAFELKPPITQEGIKMGFKTRWGVIATNFLTDSVQTGGNPYAYNGMIRIKIGDWWYWTNIYAGGGSMIFRTKELQELDPIKEKSKQLNGGLYQVTQKYDQERFPQAVVENQYVYHACTPYWNSLYPSVFKEKQKGRTIEDCMSQFDIDYNNGEPMRAFLTGNFDDYARRIYKENLNNRK